MLKIWRVVSSSEHIDHLASMLSTLDMLLQTCRGEGGGSAEMTLASPSFRDEKSEWVCDLEPLRGILYETPASENNSWLEECQHKIRD